MLMQAVVPGEGSAAGGRGGLTVSAAGRSGQVWDAFSGVQSNNYWSSSSNANNPDNAWNVNFNNGNAKNNNRSNDQHVRLVRGGE